MKKTFKFFALAGLLLGSVLLLIGCDKTKQITDKTQGVTDTEIVVGNTASTSAFANVATPFNAGIQLYFDKINKAGGVHGRKIKFVNEDDKNTADGYVTATKKLVEETKVFAIVGHFGNATGATLEILKDNNIPMFYAANGTAKMYNKEAKGVEKLIMPVQPISFIDGLAMAQGLFESPVFGAGKNEKLNKETAKIAILADDTEQSQEQLQGVEAGLKGLNIPTGNIFKETFTSASATTTLAPAINNLKAKNPDAYILAMSQAGFIPTVKQLVTVKNEAPIITSYFNANTVLIGLALGGSINPMVPAGKNPFEILTNGWLGADPNALKEWTDFCDEVNQPALKVNSFAMAGYIAAKMFTNVLQETGKELTVKKFVAAAEAKEAWNIPMGGKVTYKNGLRTGTRYLAVSKYVFDEANWLLSQLQPVTELKELPIV